jgi:hypothetical protein
MHSYIDDIFFTANEPLEKAAEPYIVPFKSDHPRQIFKNVIDAALKRAVRYSFTLSAFHAERRSIKLMLLYNGYMFLFLHNYGRLFSNFSYPPRYLYNRFNQFFPSHLSISLFYQRSILKMTLLVYVTYY